MCAGLLNTNYRQLRAAIEALHVARTQQPPSTIALAAMASPDPRRFLTFESPLAESLKLAAGETTGARMARLTEAFRRTLAEHFTARHGRISLMEVRSLFEDFHEKASSLLDSQDFPDSARRGIYKLILEARLLMSNLPAQTAHQQAAAVSSYVLGQIQIILLNELTGAPPESKPPALLTRGQESALTRAAGRLARADEHRQMLRYIRRFIPKDRSLGPFLEEQKRLVNLATSPDASAPALPLSSCASDALRIKNSRALSLAFYARQQTWVEAVCTAIESFIESPSPQAMQGLSRELTQLKEILPAILAPMQNPFASPHNKLAWLAESVIWFCDTRPCREKPGAQEVREMLWLFAQVLRLEQEWERLHTPGVGLFSATALAEKLALDAPSRAQEVEPVIEFRGGPVHEYLARCREREESARRRFYIPLSLPPTYYLRRCVRDTRILLARMQRRNAKLTPDEPACLVRLYAAHPGLPVPESLYGEIDRLQDRLLVDRSRPEAQNGLLTKIPISEIRQRMDRYDGLCVGVYQQSSLLGVCLLCPNPAKLPPLGKKLAELAARRGAIPPLSDETSPVILVDFIAQLPESSDLRETHGETPHSLVNEQFVNLLRAKFPTAHRVVCLAINRIEPIENAAWPGLQRSGWEEIPDVRYEEDDAGMRIKYRVIKFTFSAAALYL